MVKAGQKNPFKGRQFTAEIILWAVRWYLQFPISYRDLERMLQLPRDDFKGTTPSSVVAASGTRRTFIWSVPMHDEQLRPFSIR
jgi:hypothetical protein